MRLGFLSSCLGITSDDPSLPDLLRRAADRFVRAGGSVTLTEWAGMSEDERQALVDAQERILGDGTDEALRRAVSP